MQLYTSSISPFGRKCKITAMHLQALDQFELINTTAHPVDRNPELVAKNPLGQIPILILSTGQAIYDSRVICEFINETQSGNLFGTVENKWSILTDQSLADGMTDAAILVRYEQGVRPADYQWKDWITGQLDKITKGLAEFDARIETLSNRFDIGTISLICALDYIAFRLPDFAWEANYPNLAKWRQEFTQQHAVVAATAPK